MSSSQKRNWRTDKNLIGQLVDLMNQESYYTQPPGDELFYVFDAVLSTDQIEFMLQMGRGNHTLESLVEKIDLSEKKIKKLLKSLVKKGPITIIKDEAGQDRYHIMSIFPGFFEFYLMRGKKNREAKLFAKRLEEYLDAPSQMGNPEMINQFMSQSEPFMNVVSTIEPKTKTIRVDKTIEASDNIVFSAKNILTIFEEIDDNETISLGKCFCRFEKEIVSDPCRTELPIETCISIGPAAQVLLNQGLAKQITKKEAITKIKDFQKKGAVHQATLTVPLKDFQGKYQFDRLCNCCWDCCTLLGSYNRGQLPYMLQAFHKAIVANPDACTGCEICIPICPTLAISLNDSKIPEIYEKICIGCGLCDTLCPEEVFEMIEEERKVFLPMHEKSEARIKPKVSKVEKDDDFAIDVTAISDKAEVLKELENYRQLFLLEKNKKAFSNYSKTLQWHFTDIDVFYHFVVKDGVPSELKEGKIENPDIFYTLSGTVFVGMRQGIIDPMKAYRKKLTKADAAIKDLMKLSKLEEK